LTDLANAIQYARDGERQAILGGSCHENPTGLNVKWEEFELTFIVQDSQMDRSQPVKLPLTSGPAANRVIPEKWQEALRP